MNKAIRTFAAGACLLLLGGCWTPYLVCEVQSGQVGGAVQLNNRYHVVRSQVVHSDDRGLFWASKLRVVSFDAESSACMDELARLYPGVFSSGESAKRVEVVVTVASDEGDFFGIKCTGVNPTCAVEIRGLDADSVFSSESFALALIDLKKDQLALFNRFQVCRSIYVDDPYHKTVVEGFAAALVAALEKYENGGQRKMVSAPPVRYMTDIRRESDPFSAGNGKNRQ